MRASSTIELEVERPPTPTVVHVLLDEDHFLAGRHDIEHRHHVAVVNLRRDPGFVEKHRDELLVLGELGEQRLAATIRLKPSSPIKRAM